MDIKKISKTWFSDNLFSLRKGDGVAYLVFYIVIPVLVTYISLQTLPSEGNAIIYSYVTILISTMNCIYDAANRWSPETKGVKNIKLGIIMLVSGTIAFYCLYVIFYMLAKSDFNCRYDLIFLMYIPAIIVGIADIVHCFTKDMAWKACVDSNMSEGESK